jgi:type VI secretion system protein ImpA
MMDDTPTANEETRAWLRESGILDSAAAGAELRLVPGGAALPGEPLPRPSQQAYDQAMAEVRAGRPEKGVEVLMRTLEQERSERARFLRRSEMAGIMVEAGYEQVALPVLRELVAQIEAHRLEEWEEGELVARTLGLLYRCIDATGAESEDLKRELYLRICRLDPVQAISFQAPRPRPADGAPRDG